MNINKWKSTEKDSWTFTNFMIVGNGENLKNRNMSYAVIYSDSFLNGSISADFIIKGDFPSGGGLICRANELLTYLSIYLSKNSDNKSYELRIDTMKEGLVVPKVFLSKKIFLTKDKFNLTLKFFSGHIQGILKVEDKEYSIEHTVPDIPFSGYVGAIKFNNASLVLKNINISKNNNKIFLNKNRKSKYLYDVFISHSSKDKNIVSEIIEYLKKSNLSYWVDHEQINFGDSIISKIENGLLESKYILVVLSKSLGKSNWCRAEYGAILSKEFNEKTQRKVIPLLIDEVDEVNIPLLLYDKRRAVYSNKEEFYQLLNFLSI